jgi:hypothetical protein
MQMALHMRGAKELDSVVVKGVEVRRGMTVRALADKKERALLVTDIMEDQHGQYMLLFRSIPNHAGKNYLVESESWELLTPIECGVAPSDRTGGGLVLELPPSDRTGGWLVRPDELAGRAHPEGAVAVTGGEMSSKAIVVVV